MVGSQAYMPEVVQAYVIDPGSMGFFEETATPYDWTRGAEIFGFAFTMVVGLWLVSLVAGLMLKPLKGTT